MKTAAVYARYSSDKQTEQSIEGQLRVCQEYAARNNIIIVKTYIDRAMTGTNDNRDDFQRMLKDSDLKQWDYILVYKLDRFSRNKYEMAMHRKKLKDNGVKILSAMENIPDSPEGILLESLLEGMNQYFSEELSQKCRRGLRETRIKGNAIGGRIPFGWDKVEKKILLNEGEAAIVRDIFESYIAGKSIQKITEELNGRGIVNKDRPFLENAISTMLHNEKYTGVYRVREEIYDNIYPKIITREIYEQAQVLLIRNSKGKHKPNVMYLLRGKTDCGYNGRRYHSWSGNDRNGNIRRYYRCDCQACPDCKGIKSIRKEVLENAVLSALNAALNTEENLEELANRIIELHAQKAKDNVTLKLLEKELANVMKSITGIVKAIEMGVVTETTKERLEELEKQKRSISESIAVEKARECRDTITKETIKEYIRNANKQPSQAMVDLLIEKIVIFHDSIDITFKYTGQTPPDGDRPKRPYRYDKCSDPNDRGFLFMCFDTSIEYELRHLPMEYKTQMRLYFRI